MKTEAKAVVWHTAGPWRVQADPVWVGKHPVHDNRFVTTDHELEVFENEHGEIDACFPKDEGKIICKLTDSECQAGNARLIAAAPDLLEACKALARLGIEECRNCVGTGQDDNHNDQACRVCGGVGEVVVGFPLPEEVLAARSAIEKAEGRQ